jgi:hypothetical protein
MMLSLTLLIIGQQKVFAEINIPSSTYYVSFLDQYRMDYGSVTGSTNYTLHFIAANSTVFDANYAFAPTGVHYLTCNGTYSLLFYNSSNVLIASTTEFITSSIINPTCNSYASGVNGKNDLNIRMEADKIKWDALPGTDKYEIYKEGIKVDETTTTEYTPTSDGGYSVVAKDINGNIVGQSDINITKPVCDVCTKLSQLLQCPDWNNYMGDLTNAFRDALPPPPDWTDIADKIGNSVITKLAVYVGSVPNAPTQTEIDSGLDSNLPIIDGTASDAENLTPTMPPGYEVAKPFDISSGPQIPIVDESVPFQIFDPLHNIQYDNPGVPVLPGSSTNSMGGIETPVNITLPDAIPTQQATSPPGDTQEIPIPSSNIGSSGPVPSNSGGSGPIPTIIP